MQNTAVKRLKKLFSIKTCFLLVSSDSSGNVAATMTRMTRRNFLQVAGGAAVAAAALMVPVAGVGQVRKRVRNVRVRLKPAGSHRGSDVSFCRRARFATAADAIRATARRGVAAEIYLDNTLS